MSLKEKISLRSKKTDPIQNSREAKPSRKKRTRQEAERKKWYRQLGLEP